MASIYDLKPAFQNLLRPVCRLPVSLGSTPNQITIAALLVSMAAGAAVLVWPGSRAVLVAVPIVLFVRMGLNALDGMMAREHGMATPVGAVLNELGDVAADAALYLPLAMVATIPAPWMVALAVLGVVVEMTGVVTVQIGGSRRYDGPMGKSDRAFWLGALCLALGLGAPPGVWVSVLLVVLCLLSLVTVFRRVHHGLAELE